MALVIIVSKCAGKGEVNLRQRVGVFLGVLVIALAAGFAVASPASATMTLYKIQLSGQDRCLDVRGVSYADGAVIQTYHCIATQPNQKFYLNTGVGNRVQIIAYHSGKCLDVAGVSAAQGAYLQQYTCLGWSQTNQVFWQSNNGGLNTFQVQYSEWCLNTSSLNDGATVTQNNCYPNGLNQWVLAPA